MANSIFELVDLRSLPSPDVVDSPEFETIYQEILALFRTLDPTYTLLTEADPFAKALQCWAYRELILRGRINDAAKANLLAFAKGADLDRLGGRDNVARLVVQPENLSATPPIPLILEDDESFRYRIQLKLVTSSAAGGAAWYRLHALSASADVRDARVFSPDHPNGYNMGGRVNVAVLGRTGNLVPSDALLATVRAALMRDEVKVVSDLLLVEAATPRTIDVTATVRLLPNAPKAVFDSLEATLRAQFTDVQALGFDLTTSWLFRALQQAGVHSIDLSAPAANTVVAPNEFPILGTVNLTFGGYSDGEPLAIGEMERRRTQRTINETYRSYVISNKRTAAQIKTDLEEKEKPGVLQPTVQGFAQFVGIQNLKDDKDEFYKEDELAFLIWRKLSPFYV